jgi:hypothetical protein
LLIRRGLSRAHVSGTKPSDVALVAGSVTTAAANYGLVVLPGLRAPKPAMDHHVAGEAQMILIGLAGGEWLRIVFGVRVDDAPALPTSDALHRASKNACLPLAA